MLPDAAKTYVGFSFGSFIARVTRKTSEGNILRDCVASRCSGERYFLLSFQFARGQDTEKAHRTETLWILFISGWQFKIILYTYLLLNEFEGRTVSYGPTSIYGPNAKRAGHKSKGKNEDP